MILKQLSHDPKDSFFHLDDWSSELTLKCLYNSLIFEAFFTLKFQKEVFEKAKKGYLCFDRFIYRYKVDQTVKDGSCFLFIKAFC